MKIFSDIKMARLCTSCFKLCVFFCIFIQISSVFTFTDYEYYEFEDPEQRTINDQLTFRSLDGSRSHDVRKRDVNTNRSTSEQKPNDTTSIKDDAQIGAEGPQNKTTPTEVKNPADKKSTKSTKAPPKVDSILEKNLGVNGTGQRKYINTTPKSDLTNQTTLGVVPLTDTNDNSNTTSTDSDEDISITKFTNDEDSEVFNKTLGLHNITVTRVDSHIYYNSTLKTDPAAGQHYWVDLSNTSEAKINDLLSHSHRRAATVKLSFDFPFYGHPIKNVTIATGGFVYTGDYVHSWLAATQYIAPLMANFDTSISNDSYIRHHDNGTAFVVEWVKVALQDKPDSGEFTFQTTLHQNGDIVFVYKNIPLFVENITDDLHPVKVGLSDAYIYENTIFFVRRKTIYEYHRVQFSKDDIKNWTVIYLKALPTCQQSSDCVTCTTRKIPTFTCQWCPIINRCSNGLDRNRQEWLTKKCDQRQVKDVSMCSFATNPDNNITYAHADSVFQPSNSEGHMNGLPTALGPNQPVKMGVSGIVAIMFLVAMIAGMSLWVLYAYRNPHTTSGQILIRYRPTQWRWRRGEARYTAATIHM